MYNDEDVRPTWLTGVNTMKLIKQGGHRLFENDPETARIVSEMLLDLERNRMDALRKYSERLDGWSRLAFSFPFCTFLGSRNSNSWPTWSARQHKTRSHKGLNKVERCPIAESSPPVPSAIMPDRTEQRTLHPCA